jgi:hypothetical protein
MLGVARPLAPPGYPGLRFAVPLALLFDLGLRFGSGLFGRRILFRWRFFLRRLLRGLRRDGLPEEREPRRIGASLLRSGGGVSQGFASFDAILEDIVHADEGHGLTLSLSARYWDHGSP